MNECTEERFLSCVTRHEMQIIRDDGVNRHIRFKTPGTINQYFDLITWPGYLCCTGDMGTYVFQRLEDMFQFFRNDRDYMGKNKQLYINLGYWAEKVQAQDRHGKIKEFSEEKFNRVIITDLIYWLRRHKHETDKDARRDLWEAVMDDVINTYDDNKSQAAYNFSYQVNDLNFSFKDFWENNLEEYTYHFTWCCYALAWGIQTYDKAKETVNETL